MPTGKLVGDPDGSAHRLVERGDCLIESSDDLFRSQDALVSREDALVGVGNRLVGQVIRLCRPKDATGSRSDRLFRRGNALERRGVALFLRESRLSRQSDATGGRGMRRYARSDAHRASFLATSANKRVLYAERVSDQDPVASLALRPPLPSGKAPPPSSIGNETHERGDPRGFSPASASKRRTRTSCSSPGPKRCRSRSQESCSRRGCTSRCCRRRR